jgi:hypothetical protein
MAEAKMDMNVHVNVNYPKPPSTQQERIDALREAKTLVTGRDQSVTGTLFGSATGSIRQTGEGVLTLLRLAEYITTGHDYLDTHPTPPDPSKKEIRRAVRKEMKRVTKLGAGKLIMPKIVRGEE